MPDQVTVTGAQTGPAQAVSSVVHSNVIRLDFQYKAGIVQIQEASPAHIFEYVLADIVSVTYNIATGIATVTLAGT